MRVGVSVKMREGGYDRFGTEKYNRIKSHGFDCVDFDMCNINHMLYQLEERDFKKYLTAEKILSQQAGVEIFQTHGPWGWPIKDLEKADLEDKLKKMEKSIRATAILGCKYWVIHPLMPYLFDDIKQGKEKETWEINLSFMPKLLEIAKKYDVTVCLENTPFSDYSIATPEQVLKLINEINDESLQMCFDTGHIAAFGERFPGNIVRMMSDKIKVLHVHDNGGENDEHLPPFDGIIDENIETILRGFGLKEVVTIIYSIINYWFSQINF